MEEFLEEQISPLGARVKISERCADITRMENDTGHELLALFFSQLRAFVNQFVLVLTIFDGVFVEMCLEILSESVHGGHVSEQNWLDNSLFDDTSLSWFIFAAQEVEISVFE